MSRAALQANDAARRVGQRRVAVPMLELRLAEPARLQRVVAMRQPRIGAGHRRRQRVDHLALDPIGEVARIGDVGELAPAVGDLLVLDQRVHDQGEQPHVGAQRLGRAPRRRPRARRPSGSCSLPSSGSRVSSSPSKEKRSEAIVSSNSRFHAAAPGIDFSRNNCSSSSLSWCGRSLRMSSSHGR